MTNAEVAALSASMLANIIGAGWAVYLKLGKDKASAELRQIQARANAPYLKPSVQAFQDIFPNDGDADFFHFPSKNDNVLCWCRGEVSRDLPAEAEIIFVIDNLGQEPRKL